MAFLGFGAEPVGQKGIVPDYQQDGVRVLLGIATGRRIQRRNQLSLEKRTGGEIGLLFGTCLCRRRLVSAILAGIVGDGNLLGSYQRLAGVSARCLTDGFDTCGGAGCARVCRCIGCRFLTDNNVDNARFWLPGWGRQGRGLGRGVQGRVIGLTRAGRSVKPPESQ